MAKLPVLALVCAALALQLTSQLLRTRAQLYPFMDYPMYAHAHAPGATFAIRELRVFTSEAESAEGRTVSYRDLGVTPYRLSGWMRSLGEDDASEHALRRALIRRFGDRYQRAELWSRRFEIGSEGLRSRDVVPEMRHRFALAPEPAQTAAIAPDDEEAP